MTKADYIERIFRTLRLVADREWRETPDTDGMWIRDRDGRCPLCSAASHLESTFTHTIDSVRAARVILRGAADRRPGHDAWTEVVYAADGALGHDELRARLKRLLGVRSVRRNAQAAK